MLRSLENSLDKYPDILDSGPGGVQAQIDEWRDLWLEALMMVNDART